MAPAGSDTRNERGVLTGKLDANFLSQLFQCQIRTVAICIGNLTGNSAESGAESSAGKAIRSISRLPTLPDGSGEGGLEMTQANQIKKSDDFKLVIVFRIEGQNSRAIILRFAGIAATLVAIAIKLALIIATRTH
jgi:hypothetical protein